MHILHSLFTNDIGGTERHVAELANAQLAAGHRVTLMIRGNRHVNQREDVFLNWLDKGIELVKLPSNWLFVRWPLLPIWRELQRLQPDIIHTHHGRDSRYLAFLSGRVPTVASLHMRYRHKDYKRHNGLICVSNWQLKTLPETFRKKSVLIPNWVCPAPAVLVEERAALRGKLSVKEDTLLFGCVGRLSAEKAPDNLVEAFQSAAIPNSHLVIFGEGELHSSLKKQIGNAKNISLMGYEKEIRHWYGAFDVFVLPSREESFGLVLLEAMDAGCPIVATRTDGALDLLGDNKEVIFAEIASAISLSHALKRAAEKPRHRVEYKEIEMHRIDQASAAILSFYQRLLGQ